MWNDTPFKAWLWANRQTENWGPFITNPWQYASSTSGVRTMSLTAWDTIQYDDEQIATSALWTPALYTATAAIKKQDQIFNAGQAQIVNWLEAKYQYLIDKVNAYLSAELITGSTNFIGIEVAIPNNPTTGTYGNIDRSDATFTKWRSQYTDGGSLAAMSVESIINMLNKCSAGQNSAKPDFVVTTQTIWERLYTMTIDSRIKVAEWKPDPKANIGYPSIQILGRDIVWDAGITAGKMIFMNSKFVKLRTYPEADMTQTEWIQLNETADGLGKRVYVGGQLCVLAPNRCGVIYNLT